MGSLAEWGKMRSRPPGPAAMLHDHQRRFFDLALQCEVLRFGEFTLKSGRTSPYFFNAGRFDSGPALAELGACYADALEASRLDFDMLFGPAYKGIPLATALALTLAARGRAVPLAFNRKEAKAHGEGGVTFGAPLQGRVLIVDDVVTAGTAVRESITLIRAVGAMPCAVLVALDRQERGLGERSATREIAESEGLPVIAIAGLDQLLTYTGERPELLAHGPRLAEYRRRHGCPAAQENPNP